MSDSSQYVFSAIVLMPDNAKVLQRHGLLCKIVPTLGSYAREDGYLGVGIVAPIAIYSLGMTGVC